MEQGEKRNIAIKICYDGTNYYGWNIQPDKPTIQGELVKALKKLTGQDILPKGASRTDRGVHALGQVANFFVISSIPEEKFKDALNSVLPPDIRVIMSREVPPRFDARWSAREKTYKYVIYMGEINPFIRNYALCIRRKIDIEKMMETAKLFEGENDFRNFTPEQTFAKRVITKSEITEKGNYLIYEIKGRSFLRYMVRNIVGTLLMVGFGKMTYEEVKELLNTEEKKYPKFTAPPHGLYLVEVKYDIEI